MKYKKLVFSVIFIIGLRLTGLQAQELIQASGGEASGSEGSTSYSIGQVFYKANIGTDTYSIIEGVQQPYEISIVSVIEQTKGINLNCLVYPNPTSDFLILKAANFENENLCYNLLDIKGNLIERGSITDGEVNIKMEILVPAIYFIKVIQETNEIITFKIIKN